MTLYEVTFTAAALRDLKKMQADACRRLLAAIKALALEPRPDGVKKLKGRLRGYYRIRVGDHRVIYDVRDRELVVLVVRVADRREAYE